MKTSIFAKTSLNARFHSKPCSETTVWACYERKQICAASFQWKHSGSGSLNFLVQNEGIGLVRFKTSWNWAEKDTHVSDQRLSLGENARLQKWAFSACSLDESSLYKNPGTEIINQHPHPTTMQEPAITTDSNNQQSTGSKWQPTTSIYNRQIIQTSQKQRPTTYSQQRRASKNIKLKQNNVRKQYAGTP
jgi:hypothetical protein